MTGERNTNRERITQASLQNAGENFVDRVFWWFETNVLNSHKVHEDSTVRRRVVLLSVITFIGSSTLFFFGLLAFLQKATLLGCFDIAFALAFIVNLIDARIRKNYQFNIVVGIIIASCLYLFLYVNGGINRTAFVWYFSFPLMASFLLGSRKGALAMLLMALPVIALMILKPDHAFFAQYTQTFEVRFLGAYLLIGLFAYMFENAGENSRQETLRINENLENIVESRTAQLSSLNQKILKEIEQQKHAQELLTQSEQRYKALIDLSAVGILLGSHDGYVVEANKCLCDIVGIDRGDFIGRHITELAFTKESLTKEPFRFDLLKSGEIVEREREFFYPDGTKVAIEMRTVMMPDGTYQSIFSDITERNRAEQKLRASEERFRLAFHTSPDSIIINTINEGTFIETNKGFTKILGYSREDVIGKSSVTLNIWKKHEDRLLLVKGLKKYGYVENIEADFISKSGETKVGLMSASILRINEEDCVLSITRDITERKRTEEERRRVESLLQQAQKLEAIGTLAGGIAHDFNNLLMGIQGRTSLMAIDLQQSDPHMEHIRAIDEHVHSASNLTKQLLGTARGGKYDPKPTDLNELIKSSSALFGRTRKELTISTRYSQTAVTASVDRAQIEQVLLNLFVNGWQAMSEGGALHIETDIVSLGLKYCEPHQIAPGYFAKISVTDTGIGMDEVIKQQIFDPFFTTKDKDRGTGLGLASAYGIIKNHDGFITVQSEVGQGSTFTLYLPLSELEPLQENKTEKTTLKGSETILLVDDEKMIIDVGNAMLQALGYKVICAQGGEEAIRHVKEVGNEIDLVILDLIMPKLDGGRTFDQIRELCPLIPVLLSSGYAIDGQAEEIMARGCDGFLQKPFKLSDLSRKIRSIIDKKGDL